MHIIGLTGGIASGKSTVANYLQQQDIPVIDCDLLARQAVIRGKPSYYKIVNTFGEAILLPNGEIDRAKLGDIVFGDQERRLQLEEIVHKQVVTEVKQRLAAYNNREIVVVDIPLLFEAKLEYLVDEIWVVYCRLEQQLERLQQRNSLTLAAAKARISSQIPLSEKRPLADLVLDNCGTVQELFKQIDTRLYQLKK